MDIMSTGVRLSTECAGHYSTADSILEKFVVRVAVNGGALRLRGSLGPIKTVPSYDLTFIADKIPLASLLNWCVKPRRDCLPISLQPDA